jgi:hypothetical protein
MTSLIITLHSPGPRGTLDLELPDDVEIQHLLPLLTNRNGYHFKSHGER